MAATQDLPAVMLGSGQQLLLPASSICRSLASSQLPAESSSLSPSAVSRHTPRAYSSTETLAFPDSSLSAPRSLFRF